MTAETVIHRLQENGRIRPNAPAYFEKIGSAWVPTPWHEYVSQIRQTARALIALGLEPGDTVSILGFNRPEWSIMLLGAMSIGSAGAGIYTTNSPQEVQYIVNHADSKVILLENESQWAKVNAVRNDLPTLQKAILMRGTQIDDPLALSWEAFLALGDSVSEETLDARIAALEPNQLASMIYTSGTTGPPKGVMLSHDNLYWTVSTALDDMFHITANDWLVSYLPLSHIAEQAFTIHGSAIAGYPVYYAESLDKLADNLREVQPTVIFGVPRIWERFHAGVAEKLSESTGIKAKIANWAQGVGRDVWLGRMAGKEPSGLQGIKYNIANKLVYSKVKPLLGMSNMRVAVSGAAPVNSEILEFFTGLDVFIYEVYGQSEGTGPTTWNRPDKSRLGTVGPAYPGIQIKIADDGEILFKGRNVFLGYFKNQAATDETLIDEWLYSGDLGEFDADGFLKIIGRKKEIIITSGGKNIAPKNIEAALKNAPLIAEAVVIGERRKFLSALITLEPEALERFAAANGLAGSDLSTNPAVVAEVQRIVDEEVNPQFARVENIRKFSILPRNFTIEDGELTPTLKIKRRIINDNFSDEIEGMYAG